MRTRPFAAVLVAALGTTLGGCATTTTRMGTVSRDAVAREQEAQRRYTIQSEIAHAARVEDVGDALLRAAVPLCGADVTRRIGVSLADVQLFANEFRPAAREVGLSDTVSIIHVAKGSAAERAGLRPGDRILEFDGRKVHTGRNALVDATARLRDAARDGAVLVTYRRDSVVDTDSIVPDAACAYEMRTVNSDVLNAWADGKTITITSAMLRFVPGDDELATVLAHEIAHDAMHHIQAKKRNSLFGALLGAAADIAIAAGGVNTGGEFTRSGAEAGAMVFSQDFEREADYVGLYIMALAGRPIDSAPPLWRRMAAESPKSIKFASSHPTTAERFVRLEQWIEEIRRKQAAGEELRPEMKQ